MHRCLRTALVGTALAATTWCALAGRPLATDDAGTADPRTCEVEAWVDRADASRNAVLSGACGVAEGLELGLDVSRPSPRGDVRAGAGMGLKWAPEAARLDTAPGALKLGLKAALASERSRLDGWGAPDPSLDALVTLSPAEAWALHANLGVARHRASGTTGGRIALAAEWSPRNDVLLFVETLGSDRRAVFGPAVRSAGGRWWLLEERLGLDVVASRESGGRETIWSIGFGWYGIGF
jgi:hypothetical protein